ncbi:MAG TPA: hypothetical protein PLJ27_07835 [Polyangiaceae bacterium]|nr:MAG: hypothetical protein BWY17_00796 [Deltaproteobacteria bacterium ADurb.Bin207]HNS96743.1 hypothetical protein [Polyangiaceae bacterium]HNZ20674.1 hypothetical protein [Polyangiaceae bacterium]HOD20710.1 hypothetical protein [Polyangiaceae bacterium]HOE47130.1 hypothetical protein [Polyangiaceae bacterium]
MNKYLSIFMYLSLGSCLVGCALDTVADELSSEQVDATEADLSTNAVTFVTVRKDNRKCAAPSCGGYWVKDVNRSSGEQYVSGFDFGSSGFDEQLIGKVTDAPADELILRGRLGKKEAKHGTRKLLVYQAFRGLPGVKPLPGDVYFQAETRDVPIQCFTAPCPNEIAHRLNTNQQYAFSGYQVALAARPHVDQDWLVDRIQHHKAVVAALFVKGDKYPGGYEYLLDASQVYLDIADAVGPCPAYKLAACSEPDADWAYTRDVNLCLLPEVCMSTLGCPSLQPPRCEDGYSVSAWRTNSPSCIRFACDPSFVLPN